MNSYKNLTTKFKQFLYENDKKNLNIGELGKEGLRMIGKRDCNCMICYYGRC